MHMCVCMHHGELEKNRSWPHASDMHACCYGAVLGTAARSVQSPADLRRVYRPTTVDVPRQMPMIPGGNTTKTPNQIHGE